VLRKQEINEAAIQAWNESFIEEFPALEHHRQFLPIMSDEFLDGFRRGVKFTKKKYEGEPPG